MNSAVSGGTHGGVVDAVAVLLELVVCDHVERPCPFLPNHDDFGKSGRARPALADARHVERAVGMGVAVMPTRLLAAFASCAHAAVRLAPRCRMSTSSTTRTSRYGSTLHARSRSRRARGQRAAAACRACGARSTASGCPRPERRAPLLEALFKLQRDDEGRRDQHARTRDGPAVSDDVVAKTLISLGFTVRSPRVFNRVPCRTTAAARWAARCTASCSRRRLRSGR